MSRNVKAISKSPTLTLLDLNLSMKSTTLKNASVGIKIKHEVFKGASLFEVEMTNFPRLSR